MDPIPFQPESSSGQTTPPGHDRDLLITRLVDGRAGSRGWRTFKVTLPADGRLIDDIIDTASDQEALQEAMQEALAPHLARSAAMSLADARSTGPQPLTLPAAVNPTRSTGKVASKAGWAVAACLGLMLLGVIVRQTAGPLGGPAGSSSAPIQQAAGIGAGLGLGSMNSEQLINQYVQVGQQEGKVVSMLPQFIVLESRPVTGSDGKPAGHEVLYVRQVLERAVVDDVYRLGKSDTGQPVLVPADMPGGPRPGKL